MTYLTILTKFAASFHSLSMIKPRTREAGEGIDYSHNFASFVHYYQSVNRMMVHHLARLDNLGILADRFRIAGHDFRYRRCEECLPKTLHGATDIAVGNDTDKPVV